jgi:hypothetical protein
MGTMQLQKIDISFPRTLRCSLSAPCLLAKDIKFLSDEYVVQPNARLLMSLDVPQLKFNAEPSGKSPGLRQLPSPAANVHFAVALYPKRHATRPAQNVCVQPIRFRNHPAIGLGAALCECVQADHHPCRRLHVLAPPSRLRCLMLKWGIHASEVRGTLGA